MSHNCRGSFYVITACVLKDCRGITPEPLIVPVIQSYYPIMLIS